jgi:hypothetical protein
LYTCHNYRAGRQRRVATVTNADPARASDIQSASTARAHRGGVKGAYTLKHDLVIENKRRKEKEENSTKNERNKDCLKHGHTPFAEKWLTVAHKLPEQTGNILDTLNPSSNH